MKSFKVYIKEAQQLLALELREFCLDQAQKAHDMYNRAYNLGGPNYESKMKYAEKLSRKWTKRAHQVLTDERLQNALIKYI